MRIIALEEHFTLPQITGRIPKDVIAARGWPDPGKGTPSMQKANSQLPEIGSERLQLMDESGITMQVLSAAGPGADLLPPDESIVFAQDYNNALANKIALYPQRFAGFAHLPMTTPEAAAIELERTVKQLNFRGAMINGITDNLFLDHPRFEPILAKAEQLDVPLYLHPAFPPLAVQEIYYKGLPPEISSSLAGAAFGWHIEVAIHVLRLIASGTLDKFPKLQLIVGHMGETLPFMMYRSEMILKDTLKTERSVSETLRSQVNITTSGIFTLPPLMTALETFGIDKILFSVDYPFAQNEQGKKYLDSLPLSTTEIEQIAHGNADRLLKLA